MRYESNECRFTRQFNCWGGGKRKRRKEFEFIVVTQTRVVVKGGRITIVTIVHIKAGPAKIIQVHGHKWCYHCCIYVEHNKVLHCSNIAFTFKSTTSIRKSF